MQNVSSHLRNRSLWRKPIKHYENTYSLTSTDCGLRTRFLFLLNRGSHARGDDHHDDAF